MLHHDISAKDILQEVPSQQAKIYADYLANN